MPTILVIDDEAETRQLARLMLSRQEYALLEAEEAQTGIALARRHQPELILMDISMPALDGWTATRVIKSDPALAHIPIIAWTAMNIGGEAGARAAGYDGYLPKPVNLNHFLEYIASFIAARPSPAVAPAPAATIGAQAPFISSTAQARLLVLSDDKTTRQEIYQHLSKHGYCNCLEAADASSLLNVGRAHCLDLIVLDLDMRQRNGLELLQQLRADTQLATVPIIVLTGQHAAATDVAHVLKLGADDYLPKPINWEELAVRVSSRLRVKLLEDDLRRRQNFFQVLYRSGQLLSATLDPSTMLAVILEQAAAAVEATQGSLYLLDARCRPVIQLHTSYVANIPADQLEAMFSSDTVEWICSLLAPTLIENTPDHPHHLRLPQDDHTRSSLAVPLVGREGVLGILILDHDEANHFTPEHGAWLMTLAARAALALDNARLFEDMRNERKKLAAILDSSADAIVVVDDDMRLALINQAATQVLRLRASMIGYPIQETLAGTPLPTLLAQAAQHGEPTIREITLNQITYHATIRPVPGIGYVAALHDIHLLKEIEKIKLEQERQETGRVRREFARHVSPQVADLLLERGEMLGTLRKCKAAILFSDLRNYTILTERIGIEAVVEYVLKRYLTVMTDMILEHDGTINKVLGDGIMAIFGVPLPQSDAPQRALRTALAMQRALTMLRQGWQRDLNQDISMGIGLAWGEVVAGDIGGSSQRVDYTVIGDAVNLASRLGEIAAPGEVLVAEALARAVGGDSAEWRLEKLLPLFIKGKDQPQVVYRLMATV